MTGSMAEPRRSSRLMTPKTPRFWPEMKTRRRFGASWPKVTLVDIGPLDRTAGECLGGRDDTRKVCPSYGLSGSAPACSTNRPPGARRLLVTMEAFTLNS